MPQTAIQTLVLDRGANVTVRCEYSSRAFEDHGIQALLQALRAALEQLSAPAPGSVHTIVGGMVAVDGYARD